VDVIQFHCEDEFRKRWGWGVGVIVATRIAIPV
jgi:hypothetical protein